MNGLTDEQRKMLEELQAIEASERQANREAYENMGDELIKTLVQKYRTLTELLKNLKEFQQNELGGYLELAREYGAVAKTQGNFKMISNDGKYKLIFATNVSSEYDHRADMGAEKIKEHLTETFLKEDATKNDKAAFDLILSLLQKDKKTNNFKSPQINTLIAMEDRFDSPTWKKGIQLFKESHHQKGSKSYIRLYEIDEKGQSHQIPLDINKV